MTPPAANPSPVPSVQVMDLGLIEYAAALAIQSDQADRIAALRGRPDAPAGTIYLLEHPPVITLSRRPGAESHLLADAAALARAGVEVHPTDRGGDITYHGPGQLVVYPILDLNRFGLRIHDYMRLLESAVIDCLAGFGVSACRDACATGVWVPRDGAASPPGGACGDAATAKICAMGVRIRRWVSMHGLALNVSPDMAHFDLIVPCGLAGRAVTSLRLLLGDRCPVMSRVKAGLAASLQAALSEQASRHLQSVSALQSSVPSSPQP